MKGSGVEAKEVIERWFIGNDFDLVAIRFPPPCREGLQPAFCSVHVAAFHAAGHGFQCADVFVLAPVLPVAAAGEFFGVVVDGGGEAELFIDYGDCGVAGFVGGFGVEVGYVAVWAVMFFQGGGDAFVGGVFLGEMFLSGGVVQGFDFFGVVAELAAGVAEGVAEVDVEEPGVGLVFVAGVEEFVADVDDVFS